MNLRIFARKPKDKINWLKDRPNGETCYDQARSSNWRHQGTRLRWRSRDRGWPVCSWKNISCFQIYGARVFNLWPILIFSETQVFCQECVIQQEAHIQIKYQRIWCRSEIHYNFMIFCCEKCHFDLLEFARIIFVGFFSGFLDLDTLSPHWLLHLKLERVHLIFLLQDSLFTQQVFYRPYHRILSEQFLTHCW